MAHVGIIGNVMREANYSTAGQNGSSPKIITAKTTLSRLLTQPDFLSTEAVMHSHAAASAERA